MRIRKKYIIVVVSQLLITLAFFAGMILNYYTLYPIIDSGETWRIMTEIDDFYARFFPDNGCDAKDSVQLGQIAGNDPYLQSDFLLMDGTGEIIYAKNGGAGKGSDIISARYGERAVNLLEQEMTNPGMHSRMYYDQDTHLSVYCSYEKTRGLILFYTIDYRISGSDVIRKFQYLTLFMCIGGFIIILISFFVIRGIILQTHRQTIVEQELDTAATIQKSMIPRGGKQLLQLDGDARLLPAKKVGGDLYCYLLREGILYFIIGDVSGKGIPASIFMSRVVTLFRSFADARLSAKKIAEKLNDELCLNNEQNMFLTGIVGTIRVTDGHMDYVNAGHELPVIWNGKEDSSVEFLASRGNIPLGVMADTEFNQENFEIPRNGMILFYTDGISEARSSRNKLLGRENLLRVVQASKSLSCKDINDALLGYIFKYESGVEQSDDITVLTFKNSPKSKRIVLKNEVPELRKLAPFTEEIFMECPMEHKQCTLLRSGLDEALTNCVNYAYPSGSGEIILETAMEGGRLCFTITDWGIPFNPLEYAPEPSGELKIGGLGINMYRAVFDEVQYLRSDNSNILKLIKNI